VATSAADQGCFVVPAWDLLGHVDGLALLSSRLDVSRLRELARQSTPVVLMNRLDIGVDLPMAGVDSFTAMLEIFRPPRRTRTPKVVYLSGSEPASQDREWWRAVQTSSRFLRIEASHGDSDGTIETSYHQAEEAQRPDPPRWSASAASQRSARISKLRELGLDVPGNISVTGFDDIAIGRHTFPTLTTASCPRNELGRRAWNLRHNALQDRRPTQNATLLPAPLIGRASAGPARNGRD
jgi:DNA-binding LacI/PurR family transcriptional regulator